MQNRILLIAFLLFTSILEAQKGVSFTNFNGVDNQINNFLDTWDLNGAGVAITKDGKLIYNKGFGYSDLKRTKAVLPDDLFRIASVSKPITSIAIMKLFQEGKLSISDTVFGENRILDQNYYTGVITDKRIYSITIQNLLEHTSGWDRYAPCDGYSHSDSPFFPLHVTSVLGETNPVGDSSLIKFSLLKGLVHDPGTTYVYSNVGYLVLGKIIEKITGMKYEEYVENNIFQPLGINDIHLGKNLLTNAQEREVEYFNTSSVRSCYGDGKKVPSQYGGFSIEAMNAHGGWIASAADLTKLILAVDGFSTVPDILSPEAIKVMSSGGSENQHYAKGWYVNSGNWFHTGSLDGSSSYICRTADGYTWAFLFNSRSDNSNAFWNALDKLPWNCLQAIEEVPDTDLFEPAKNVTNLSAIVTSPSSIDLTWTKGSGDGRIIIMTERSVFSYFPEDGINYIPDPIYGKGSKLAEKTFVVYNGTGSGISLTGLDPSKTYLISGLEYYKNADTGNIVVYKPGGAEKKSVTTSTVYVQDF